MNCCTRVAKDMIHYPTVEPIIFSSIFQKNYENIITRHEYHSLIFVNHKVKSNFDILHE